MKGEEKLWAILNDKLDNLRATNRLSQAIRVAETALEVARRAFKGNQTALATSFEKLGQLLEQKGDHAGAEAYLLKAHAILEKGTRLISALSTARHDDWPCSSIVSVNPKKQSIFIRKL
jgi:hypothetical protein